MADGSLESVKCDNFALLRADRGAIEDIKLWQAKYLRLQESVDCDEILLGLFLLFLMLVENTAEDFELLLLGGKLDRIHCGEFWDLKAKAKLILC